MQRPRHKSVWIIIAVAFLTGWSSLGVWYAAFSGFSPWDDEGAMMMSVHQFVTGGTLYENVWSVYGPTYYLFNWLIHGLTQTPVTHTMTRVTTAVMWVACSMLAAWIVWRISRSLRVTLAAHFPILVSLRFFASEPGHPQELCMLLLLGLLATGLMEGRRRRLGLMLAGAAVGGLLLVKINIGLFAGLALALTITRHLPIGLLSKLGFYACGGLALLLPFGLMRSHLDDPLEVVYCIVVTAGVAGLLSVLREPEPGLEWTDAAATIAGFAGTCAIVLSIIWLKGTDWSSILYSLVLYHIQISVVGRNWFWSPILHPFWTLWAVAGVALAMRAGIAAKPSEWMLRGKAVFGALCFVMPLLAPRDWLLGFATPFCWLVVAGSKEDSVVPFPARVLLAFTATFQTLYAYPIAGSQAFFLMVPLLMAGAVCLADGLRGSPASALRARMARPLTAILTGGILLCYPMLTFRHAQVYASLTPLGMPGTDGIRVKPAMASDFDRLVQVLNANCDTFVGYPGYPSLYFWTGKLMPGPKDSAPGPLNFDAWPFGFTPREQQKIVDEFAGHPNSCVVHNAAGVAFWNRAQEDWSQLPLVKHIDENFVQATQIGRYELRIRGDRTVAFRPDADSSAQLPAEKRAGGAGQDQLLRVFVRPPH